MAEVYPTTVFIEKRVEKALKAGELRLAFNLIHILDPLPKPFHIVLKHLGGEEILKDYEFQMRRTAAIRLCLKTIKRGYFSIY
jgi:hypothetical protein